MCNRRKDIKIQGMLNEPVHIYNSLNRVSRVFNMSVGNTAHILYSNAMRLLRRL